MTEWVLLAHLAAAGVLAGIGWLTQLALYPQFRRISPAAWPDFHAAHSAALGRVVALPWGVQGATTLALLTRRPDGVPFWIVAVDAALAAGPVAVTAFGAVPLHRRLGAGLDQQLVTALLRANLIRTAAWTAGIGTASVLVVLAS